MRRLSLTLVLPLVLIACSPATNEVASLGLEGKIVYSQGPEGVWELDLEKGEAELIWELSEGGFVSQLAVSPDGSTIAMAYAPQTDSAILRSDLYLLDADGANLRPLLIHRTLYEAFNHPAWSADGQWIYFTRSDVLLDESEGTGIPVLNIERVPVAGGDPQLVIEDAEQPDLSGDGQRLTYLRFNQETSTRSLWTANSDGSNPLEVVPDTAFFDMSSPRLSPDGDTVGFGGSGDLSTSSFPDQPAWLAVLGVRPAYAHGLPWDFYTVPSNGGEITRISSWGTDGTVLAWSPDGDELALMHIGGLFAATGEEPSMLVEAPHHGGIDWTAVSE